MATPIDQAYLWSINPVTGMDPSGNMGLGSLIPTASLNPAPSPTPLNVQYPTAKITPGNNFNFFAKSHVLDQAPAPDLNPQNQPYFDPYYPNESMVALKNWLGPQVAEGSLAGLRARGIYSSGVGDYAQQNAIDYLNSVAPNVTPQEAQGMDLTRMYGTSTVDQLVKEGMLPGVSLSGLPQIPNTGYAGIFVNPDQNGPAYMVKQESTTGGANFYGSPGYWYSPDNMPDASKMPWLVPPSTKPKTTYGYSPNV